ncbi:uncharacterized protein mylk4a [Diretmus argenteus]
MSSLVMNTMGDQKDGNSASFDLIQNRIESLSSKMDRLINIQEKVLNRLDGMSQDIDGIESNMDNLKVDKEEIHIPPKVVNQTQVVGGEMKDICQEMSSIMSVVNQRSEQQAQKLEGMEKLVLSMQQVISFIGETVKSSRVIELMLKGPTARKASKPKDNKGKLPIKTQSDTISKKADKKTTATKATKGTQEITPACEPSTLESSHKIKLRGPKHILASRKCGKFLKDHKGKDGKEKPCLSLKGLKAQKKKKPPDTADPVSPKKHVLFVEEVQELNRENTEKSDPQPAPEHVDPEVGGTPKDQQHGACSPEDAEVPVAGKDEQEEEQKVEEGGEAAKETEVAAKETEVAAKETESKLDEQDVSKEREEGQLETPAPKEEEEVAAAVEDPPTTEVPDLPAASDDSEKDPIPTSSDDHKGSSPPPEAEQDQTAEVSTSSKRHGTEEDAGEADHKKSRHVNNTSPPGAPFNHRIVSAKPHQINNFYTINRQEMLGGGRFGQVHKCVENSSGLTLAAKIIKAKTQKEKDVVKNEIVVMNHLDHANLIQLYAAYESRNDVILVLEYVDGGELFDRIIDENYTLMELDTVMFIRQICDGLQYMHKMYILHLDLKPENILCVSRLTNKIKIIDFGLARIYKPREKLKVNFGTPEFLAPEVINYDYVSFNTDMWSLGVITYMLLSGLCPFLGDDNSETLNNILACKWNFDEEEFIDTSDEAKEFISKLLVPNKSWRMGVAEALRHPWLADPVLHHRLFTKKTMCRSRRSSCVPITDS